MNKDEANEVLRLLVAIGEYRDARKPFRGNSIEEMERKSAEMAILREDTEARLEKAMVRCRELATVGYIIARD